MSVNGKVGLKLIKHKVYEVTWNDHYSTTGIFDHKEINIVEEVVFKTVGYFVKEDKKHYHLAQTLGESDYSDIMSILKKSTLDIKELN